MVIYLYGSVQINSPIILHVNTMISILVKQMGRIIAPAKYIILAGHVRPKSPISNQVCIFFLNIFSVSNSPPGMKMWNCRKFILLVPWCAYSQRFVTRSCISLTGRGAVTKQTTNKPTNKQKKERQKWHSTGIKAIWSKKSPSSTLLPTVLLSPLCYLDRRLALRGHL